MSKVVRVVGGIVGTVVGFVIRDPSLIMASIALTMGGLQEMLLKKPRISNPGDAFRDFSTNVSDPVGALPIVYGDQTVGVHRVWAHTEDETVNGTLNANRFLYILCAIAHGPIQNINAIYLDGVFVLTHPVSQHPNRFVNAGGFGGGVNWFDAAIAQWASGTDGQLTVIPNTDSRTVTSLARTLSTDLFTLTTSTAHPFEAGDTIRITGNSVSGYNLPGGYSVNSIPTSTTALLTPRTGQPTGTGTGGTVDFYNMDPSAITGGVGPAWSSTMQGKGVAYLLMRFRYDETKFSGQVPQIEVAISGKPIRDTRSVSAITITSAASGTARTGYGSTTDLSFAAAHGRSVGDQLLIAGHSNALLNGYQRVDEIVDSDTIRIYTPFTAGSSGNATILPYSENPAMIVRDYLVSDRYGVAVPTTELDETAFQTEANYCDESVTAKHMSFPRTAIISVGATNPAIIASTAHGLITGNIVRIWNSPVALVNGLHSVTFIDANNVSIPINNSGGATTGGGWMQVYRTTARYTANAVLSPAESLKTNLEKLLTSYRAQMVYQAGVYRTWTRRAAYPVAFELTPQNIMPGSFRYHRPGLNEMANRVRAAFYFFEANIAAGRADFAEWPCVTGYTNPELTTEDNGFESLHEIDLPATTDSFMAEQIAQIVRNESRSGLIVGLTATQAALQLAVGDIVNVTHDTPQWNRKKFWVMQIAIQPEGLVGLTLLEYSAAAYTTKWYPDET